MVIKSQFAAQLRDACGGANVLSEPADCWPYGSDNSRMHAPPDAVVFPESHDAVAATVRACREHRVPLTTRGRGTGTTGAAVPIHGGVVLSFERMDRILELDITNRFVRVQPGVTNQALQDYCAPHGLFWPPDPGSAAYCTLGGNLACNAAGPRAVKYGTPRENTLQLKAVTGAGDTLVAGTRTSKGVVGLDLTRLLIGSEGTLAVITEAVLKLSRVQPCTRTMRAVYASVAAAVQAVGDIMAQPVTPCALELMDDTCLKLLRADACREISEDAQALLMIAADGSETAVAEAEKALREAAANDQLLAFETAATAQEAGRLWAARKALSPTLRNFRPCKINEDVVVPISRITDLVERLREIAGRHGVHIASFGHAGNGNLHVNILHHPAETKAAEEALSEIFKTVIQLDGTLSGEHGIGLAKRDFVELELDDAALALMRRITRAFDPDDILNSGKSLPVEAGS